MAEIPNTGGEGGNAPSTAEAGNQAPVPKQAGANASEGSDGAEDGEGSEEEGEGEESEPEDDGSEPSVRRDASYFIGLRKGKKLAKQQMQKNQGDEGDDDGDEDEDGDGDITETVNKAIKPIADKLMKQEDESELSGFLTQNPHFKPYEKKIRRFMQHDSRSHLPISTVAMEAVGPDTMLKIGAKLARNADTKKDASKGGPTGGNRAPAPKANVWEMPKEDFQTMQNQVRYGKR